MTWDRATYLSETRLEMDATGAGRWTDPEVERKLSEVADELWLEILDVAPTYRVSRATVARDSQGRVALGGLSGGSGDTLERFYRVLGFGNSGDGFTIYEAVPAQDWTWAVAQGSQAPVWWREGSAYYLLPVAAGATVDAVVNHRPQEMRLLSAANVAYPFPEGHERAIVLEAAARLLLKGAAEANEAAILRQEGARRREQLLDQVRRESPKPTLFRFGDSPQDWGG